MKIRGIPFFPEVEDLYDLSYEDMQFHITAVHEAAHFVTGCILGAGGPSLLTIQLKEGHYMGMCRMQSICNFVTSPPTRRLLREVMSTMAGNAATWLYLGAFDDFDGGSNDVEEVHHILEYAFDSPEEGWVMAEGWTYRVLFYKSVIKVIAEIAGRLMKVKTMPEDELEDSYLRITKRFLYLRKRVDHWMEKEGIISVFDLPQPHEGVFLWDIYELGDKNHV